jgi:alkylated DNA repair protein alkB family protein 1
MAEEPDKNAFKLVQARHRRRPNDPNRSDDLNDLVDFSGELKDDRIIQLKFPEGSSNTNLPNIYHGPIFGLKDFPGFLYAPQALSVPLQLELAYRSVSDYCEQPHRTNIDLCQPKKNEVPNFEDKMWEMWKEEHRLHETSSKKQKPDPNAKRKYRSFKKLSWTTMGYHYDWTQRAYHEGCKSNMPTLVRDLAIQFARTSLLLERKGSSTDVQFTPSASIVNYYNQKSNMGGHKDDLELATDKPIVSISVGLPAIFLLGGKSKEDEPILPILVRPGDVMCMGGDSRMNFHGMARLLPTTVPLSNISSNMSPTIDQQVSLDGFPQASKDTIPETDKTALEEYLSQHRININVRQVYPDAS